MIYEEYENIRKIISQKEKKLFQMIEKREELFNKTQPKSSKLDKEKVDGKKVSNVIEEYLIEMEYLDKQIEYLNQTLDDIYQVLKRKREELKLSKDPYDRIYYYREIERLNMYKIASLIGYSKEQTYRYYRKIKNDTK